MNASRDRILFWCLIAAEAAGSQTLIWVGLPIYHRLRSSAGQGATLKEGALALAAVALMQVAHWVAHRLKRGQRFRRNVLLGQLLVCIGELSLLFTAGLATLIVFDRFAELQFALWKPFVLLAILFAATSYKHRLMSLGEKLIEGEPDTTIDN